jgi:hypothetical protein
MDLHGCACLDRGQMYLVRLGPGNVQARRSGALTLLNVIMRKCDAAAKNGRIGERQMNMREK